MGPLHVLFRYSRFFERRHFLQYLYSGFDKSHGKGGASPLAEAELQVKDRFRAQMVEHELVSDLHRPMGCENVVFYVGKHFRGNERPRGGNEAVYDNGDPAGGAADD